MATAETDGQKEFSKPVAIEINSEHMIPSVMNGNFQFIIPCHCGGKQKT